MAKYYYVKNKKIVEIDSRFTPARLRELRAEFRNVTFYNTKDSIPAPEGYELSGEEFVMTKEAAAAARKQEIIGRLQAIDVEQHSDRTWREYVISNASAFNTTAVERMQHAEDESQALRTELASL